MDMNFENTSFLQCMEISILALQELQRKTEDYLKGDLLYRSKEVQQLKDYVNRAQTEMFLLYMDDEFRLAAQKIKYE